MPLYYKMEQLKSSVASVSGKYIARTFVNGMVSTEELAQRIADNCTAKYSDVLAVINEIVYQMRLQFEAGHAVKLDAIGTFLPRCTSKAVDSVDTFNQTTDMKSPHVQFIVERKGVRNSKGKLSYYYPLTKDVKLKKASTYVQPE